MENLKKAMIIRGGNVIGAIGDKYFSTAPIGTVLAYAGNEAPRGYLLADGASYPTAEYPDLYAVIGNTYGGDTENFNVPNLVDKFIQGSNTSGTEKEAGLPNITGVNGAVRITNTSSSPSGAFYRDNPATYTNNVEGAGTTISFDASLSNPIYGNSDTVQPPALTMVYIIKAFHTNEGVDSGVSDDVVNYVDRKINDSEIQTNTTWSSSKINEELEDVRGELDIIVEEANKNTTINDSATSLTTTWSSKKTSDELGKKSNTINISMVGLGFTKGAEVPLEDFMIAISEKMSNNYSTIYKVNWTDENSAYVVFGNKKVNINGGVLYCSQSNTITNTWTDLTILYTPNISSPNLYKFTARKDGSTLNVYMFEYPYMADTTSSTTSTYSSAKIDEKYGSLTLASEGSTQWLKLKLGTSSKFQPIVVSDQYGGKVEILGMANDGTYKPVKLVRYSYGDWTTYSATDYTTTDQGDANYKIRRLFYYPTDSCYYLEIRQWGIIKVEGNSTAEMVASLPAETSAMTLIPESQFASKKDIDGTTIKTTSTTGSEYYAITFKDKQFERGNNQGILIQHNRLNFEPVTFIFSASSYSAASYERDNYDVTKINGAFYNPNSPYMMQFYMDKTNNTLYLSAPSYSGVTLTDLQFKSDVIAYTKVDAIPDTATKITVTEYATKADLGSNVPMTEITFTNSTNWSNSSGNLKTFYEVRNGWCFLHVVAHCNKVANDANSVVYNNLPMPPYQVYGKFVGEDNTYEPCNLTVATNGQMLLRGGTAGKDYSFTYTYPVA